MLKLELEALKKAINTDNEELRNLHIKNALFFRDKRQSNDEKKIGENSLELNEGLAEYTAIMLSGRNTKEIELHLTNSINQFYSNPTFVRSFAYQTIPVYGYFLSQKNSGWQKNITKTTKLTDYFINKFSMQIPSKVSFESIAKENDYDYQNIVEKEKARESKRLVKIEGYWKKYMEEPTLTLFFENMNISFDPRNITPLENVGTVYPYLRVTDNWGILTVENGALLNSNWGSVIVSAPFKINSDIVQGDGWTLELNRDWKVTNTNHKFELKKK